MKTKYCPLDNHELEFGGEIGGFYFKCSNCGIFYSYKNSKGEEVNQEDLIQEAFDLVKNKGQRLKELGYKQEIPKILYLANTKTKAKGLQKKLNFPNLSEQEPKILDFKKEKEKTKRKKITNLILKYGKSF